MAARRGFARSGALGLPGLVPCLLGIKSTSQLGRDPLLGNIFENMVIMEALKNRFNTGKRPNLFFFRDTKGFEIDLILEEARRPRPIEIKSGMTFTPAMVKNVEKFAKFVPDSLPPALIYADADMGMFHNVQICNFTHYNNIFCET